MQKIDKHAFVVIVGRLEQDGSGAVAKDDASGTIFIIDDGRHHIRSDSYYCLVGSGVNELRGDLQGVDKAGTCRRNVKSPRAFASELVLNEASCGRKQHI